MKTFLLASLCTIVFGASEATAQNVFLYTQEIPGCSIRQGFEDHHQVDEFDSFTYVPVDVTGRITGSRVYSPIYFAKETDCSTSIWRRYLAEGRNIPEAVFKFTRIDREGFEDVYFEVLLEDVRVVSAESDWSFDALSTRTSPSGEQIGLLFRSICWSFVDGGIEYCDSWTEPPLSVALIYFDAVPDGDDVHLRWGVSALETVAAYEVLHRGEGDAAFESIAQVDAVFDPGLVEYQATVHGLDHGTHAFRLKEIKVDGSVDFSSVIEVDVRATPLAYRLNGPFPNPAGDFAELTLALGVSQQVEIAVYDLMGRRVAVLHDGLLESERTHSFRLELGRHPAGIYAIRLTGKDFQASTTLLHVR